MNPDVLPLLCAPRTHDPLELVSGPTGPEALRGLESGRSFRIREGIPVFLEETDLAGPNAKYQRLYDRIAPFYDVPFRIMSSLRPGWEQSARGEYLRELAIRAGDTVLEVSVGTGGNLRYLPRTARYFGLDISWGMLKRCRKRLRRAGIAVELFQGAAEALPFRSQTFEVVFHVGGINFFSDKAAALREMARVAKPGTRILVVDETEQVARGTYERIPYLRRYFRGREEEIVAPIDLVPPGMQDPSLRELRNGDFYCLEFTTPA